MSFFAADYFEARRKFLEAAEGAGARIETIWHPHAKSPDGRDLAIDVASLGRARASHILFTVCGTHGVEGYPGSAAQIQLLQSGLVEQLPDHVGVVLLHGLNPYGWSRDSQKNEDQIDINRNFIDFSEKPSDDVEATAKLASALKSQGMSFPLMIENLRQLEEVRDLLGTQRFLRSVAGQYTDPLSIKFGGFKPCWSNRRYRDIARAYLSEATHIAELDWHTGLGEYGQTVPLCFAAPGTEEYMRTAQWWGEDAVAMGRRAWAPDDIDTTAPDYSGLVHFGLEQELNHSRIAGGTIEFGTLPLDQLGLVVILDHWLTFGAATESDKRFWRAQMRTFMAPRDTVWEKAVLTHSDRLYKSTLKGLAQWESRQE